MQLVRQRILKLGLRLQWINVEKNSGYGVEAEDKTICLRLNLRVEMRHDARISLEVTERVCCGVVHIHALYSREIFAKRLGSADKRVGFEERFEISVREI